MDFLNFFGLKEDPFKLTPDPAYFYLSSSHNEGLLLMDYSTEQREGFLLIVGDPGTGKTTLLNVFLEKWKAKAEIAIILTPRLSPEEFLISVIEDLGINLEDPRLRPPTYDMRGQAWGADKNKNKIIKTLMDFMIKKSSEDKRVIIVVDEAQNLPDETLEELRLLSNIETDKHKLLQIILIGQPELESRLTTNRLRQLNQRITTRIHLKHFRPDETIDYINYRLIKAGNRNLKIHKKAGKLIFKLSNGIPRLINMMMSRSLMAAYLEESNIIHPRHINHAVKSLNHSDIKIRKLNKLILMPAGFLLLFLIMVIGYIYNMPNIIQEYQKGSNPLSPASPIQQEMDITSNVVPLPVVRSISVKTDAANIRDMPSLNSNIIGWALKGNQFEISQEQVADDGIRWYQIIYKGKEGWISEEVVDVVDLDNKSE